MQAAYQRYRSLYTPKLSSRYQCAHGVIRVQEPVVPVSPDVRGDTQKKKLSSFQMRGGRIDIDDVGGDLKRVQTSRPPISLAISDG